MGGLKNYLRKTSSQHVGTLIRSFRDRGSSASWLHQLSCHQNRIIRFGCNSTTHIPCQRDAVRFKLKNRNPSRIRTGRFLRHEVGSCNEQGMSE
jgi:hypothetical protein